MFVVLLRSDGYPANIHNSKSRSHHLDYLLRTIVDERPHACYLGILVLRTLLPQLNDKAKFTAAQRTLDVLASSSMKGLEEYEGDVDSVSVQRVRVWCGKR